MVSDTSWMRNREGMGIWEHRGKVAVVGWVSPIWTGAGTVWPWTGAAAA